MFDDHPFQDSRVLCCNAKELGVEPSGSRADYLWKSSANNVLGSHINDKQLVIPDTKARWHYCCSAYHNVGGSPDPINGF
jgi:hypothetical protein